MNIKSSIAVYPSYQGIQQQLHQKYLQKYQRKVNSLKTHLNQLQSKHDFSRDHLKIQNSILTLSTQNPHYNTHQQRDSVKVKHHKKGSCVSSYQGQSLNYYIEDDGEEESNYQTYLKFKKKTLQRDIEEEKISRLGLNRKQKEEEELFFKNLYFRSYPNKEAIYKKNSRSINKMRPTPKNKFNHSGFKENVSSFLKKVQKNKVSISDQEDRTQQKTQERQSEISVFEKNKKYLTQNYTDILKKLGGTNIVKWRVLNTEIV